MKSRKLQTIQICPWEFKLWGSVIQLQVIRTWTHPRVTSIWSSTAGSGVPASVCSDRRGVIVGRTSGWLLSLQKLMWALLLPGGKQRFCVPVQLNKLHAVKQEVTTTEGEAGVMIVRPTKQAGFYFGKQWSPTFYRPQTSLMPDNIVINLLRLPFPAFTLDMHRCKTMTQRKILFFPGGVLLKLKQGIRT